MKNLIVIIAILSTLLVGCEPSMTPQSQGGPSLSWEDTTTVDSIPTLEITSNIKPIVITISGNNVQIESENVNTVYTTEVDRLVLNRTESGLVEYIQINNDILFKENAPAGVNHNYRYLDNNQIEVIKGNTINGIISDHQNIGLTRRKLYNCNPFLNKRGLQIGDVLNLDCN